MRNVRGIGTRCQFWKMQLIACRCQPWMSSLPGLRASHFPQQVSQECQCTYTLDEIALTPCDSEAGKRRGMRDPRSGALVSVLSYIVTRRPRVAILEQVPGLLHKQHREVFRGICKAVRIHYVVSWKVAALILH